VSTPVRVRPKRWEPGDEEGHEGGMERWLLTYADMITLLLALFVILYAISSINQSKFSALKKSVEKSLAASPNTTSTHKASHNGIAKKEAPPKKDQPGVGKTGEQASGGAAGAAARSVPPSSLKQIEEQLQAAFAARHELPDVKLDMERRGLVVRLVADSLFFANDSAALNPLGVDVVNTAGTVLAKHANAVVVEGYADNLPVVGGPYNSNWALSAARATTVVLQLDHTDHVNPSQLAATGYGSAHPIVPNTSPANQAQNRRVNIVVLRTVNPRV
jgi:chemotaxis protein MotB